MADPISGVGQHVVAQNLGGEKMQQSGAGNRSFDGVMQKLQQEQAGAQQSSSAGGAQGEQPVSRAQLEEMQQDLMSRINRLPPGSPNANALLPELLDTRTHLGMLRKVFETNRPGAPANTDLRGRLGQVENEWNQVEQIMRTSPDMSTGELLALQARLYQVSQHVEVLSKVVDQVTGGIKTILNTNV